MAGMKFLDYSGVETLWKKIRNRYDKKLDSVTNHDDSIEVTSDREISVKVSSSEGNLLDVKQDGLYSGTPVLHKLTFGAGGEFVYDGTKDITVPVYDGSHEINE